LIVRQPAPGWRCRSPGLRPSPDAYWSVEQESFCHALFDAVAEAVAAYDGESGLIEIDIDTICARAAWLAHPGRA
jgi:hypothetical protein